MQAGQLLIDRVRSQVDWSDSESTVRIITLQMPSLSLMIRYFTKSPVLQVIPQCVNLLLNWYLTVQSTSDTLDSPAHQRQTMHFLEEKFSKLTIRQTMHLPYSG